MNIIKKQKEISFRGEVVSKIISSRHYVSVNSKIIDVANELTKLKGVNCVGITDDDEKCLGVLSREKIFDVIGKPYGREVLSYKNVNFLIENTKSFYSDENIMSIIDEVKKDLQKDTPVYYIIKSREEKFVGIFSNIDLMIYLSNMIQNDIKLASDLQKSIVKEDIYVEKKNYSILFYSNMAKEIGGDFYFFKNNKNKIFISLCDVSGKGVSASLITTFLAGEHFASKSNNDIENFIYNLNKDLFTTFQLQKFITAVFTEIEIETGNAKFYDMGHSLIFLIRDKDLIHLNTKNKNLPLGVTDDIKIKENKFTFKSNDLLVLFTDGLIEQVNTRYEEFGIERALKYIKAWRNDDLKKIKDCLIKELFAFKENFPQSDDISFVIFKYHPISSSIISS